MIGLDKIMHTAFFTPMGQCFAKEEAWGLPVLLHGPPGAAKTVTMRRLALTYQVPYDGMKPGARGEAQFGVTPAVVTLTKELCKEMGLSKNMIGMQTMDFPPPLHVLKKFNGGAGLLNVDEINTAPPALQAPLLGLIQERELGVYFFGPRTRIFGCTNTTEDAAGGHDLAPAVANRLVHIEVRDPDQDDWVQWMIGGARAEDEIEHIDVEREERRVMTAWGEEWARAVGKVAGFLRARPECFRRQPPAHDPNASASWASPRTWEYATRALAAAAVQDLDEDNTSLLVGGCIGSVYPEFVTWVRNADLPDPGEFLDGKAKFKHNDNKLDRTMAVLSSCTALLTNEKCENRIERARRMWNFIGTFSQTASDLTATTVRSLHKHSRSITNLEEARAVLVSMDATLNADDDAI